MQRDDNNCNNCDKYVSAPTDTSNFIFTSKEIWNSLEFFKETSHLDI